MRSYVVKLLESGVAFAAFSMILFVRCHLSQSVQTKEGPLTFDVEAVVEALKALNGASSLKAALAKLCRSG